MGNRIRAALLTAPEAVCAEPVPNVVGLPQNAIQRQIRQPVLHAIVHFAKIHCLGAFLSKHLEKVPVNVVILQLVVQLIKQGIDVPPLTKMECVCVEKRLYVPKEAQ